jgi:hypothetical protein
MISFFILIQWIILVGGKVHRLLRARSILSLLSLLLSILSRLSIHALLAVRWLTVLLPVLLWRRTVILWGLSVLVRLVVAIGLEAGAGGECFEEKEQFWFVDSSIVLEIDAFDKLFGLL